MSLTTMVIVLVIIAVVVGFIFRVIVSGIIKFLAALALVLCVGLVISIFAGNLQGKDSPMIMQDEKIYLHIADKDYTVPYESVRQINISESENGYLIRIYAGKQVFEVEVSSVAYRFSLKSDIAKHFGKVLKNHTH